MIKSCSQLTVCRIYIYTLTATLNPKPITLTLTQVDLVNKLPQLHSSGWRKTNDKLLVNVDLLNALYIAYSRCPHVHIVLIRRDAMPENVLNVKKTLSHALLMGTGQG